MDVISFTVCLGSKTIFTLQIRYSILTVFPDFKDFQEIKKTIIIPKQIKKRKFQPKQSNLAQITPKTTIKIRKKVQNRIKIRKSTFFNKLKYSCLLANIIQITAIGYVIKDTKLPIFAKYSIIHALKCPKNHGENQTAKIT